MARFIWHGGSWVPRAEYAAAGAGVAILRDFDAPLLCHADGRLHGSRSTYNAAVREAGLEIVGRSDMKRLEAGPAVRATKLDSPRAMLTRLLNEG